MYSFIGGGIFVSLYMCARMTVVSDVIRLNSGNMQDVICNLASKGQIREEETTSSTQQNHLDSIKRSMVHKQRPTQEGNGNRHTRRNHHTTNDEDNRPDGRPRK
ncbi:hypothetical protein HHI36_002523 [Cryptolaemus montrouzieri]|uniref:Secreted protein n=1 Tax=Cryptolaemus montrouzieri TaxID=559131 RepID=A0ABD2PBJ8_9CUCU